MIANYFTMKHRTRPPVPKILQYLILAMYDKKRYYIFNIPIFKKRKKD